MFMHSPRATRAHPKLTHTMLGSIYLRMSWPSDEELIANLAAGFIKR
jgi:hypothetical protein